MNGRARIAINTIALCFSLLGGMTLLAHVVGLARAHGRIPIGLTLISTAYGVLALATGVLLFRRSSMAPRVFLLWCATFALFIAAVPEMQMGAAIPGYILGVVVLSFVYRYISRHLDGPRIGSSESQSASS